MQAVAHACTSHNVLDWCDVPVAVVVAGLCAVQHAYSVDLAVESDLDDAKRLVKLLLLRLVGVALPCPRLAQGRQHQGCRAVDHGQAVAQLTSLGAALPRWY